MVGFDNLTPNAIQYPSNNFEASVAFINPSDMLAPLPEGDKAFKLSQIDKKSYDILVEKQEGFQAFLRLKKMIIDRYAANVQLIPGLEIYGANPNPILEDSTDLLRESFSMLNTASSVDGFERVQQTTTTSKQMVIDPLENTKRSIIDMPTRGVAKY